MRYRQSLLAGALLIVVSELLFASMAALIKALSAELPNEMIVFLRNLVGLAVVLPLALRGGSAGGLGTRVLHLHALRAVSGLGAMYCFFYALGELPLVDAVVLKLTAPIFIPIVALIWLAEPFPSSVRWAVAIGFVGAILVLRPQGALALASIVGVVGGALAGFAKVVVRRLSESEPTSRIVFYFALVATAISAVPLAWSWQTPTGAQWPLLAALGLVATLGQLALSRAYGVAPAGQVAPFTYFSVIFGALYGWLFWDELLPPQTVFGAIFIFSAGMLIFHGERRRHLIATTAAEAQSTGSGITS